MKILELFAGIGACSTALKKIGIDLEIVDAVEIDKYAMASFNAIHGTNFKIQDIVEYDKVFEDLDLITHGSPCQDFSVAGKQAGGDLGSGTRSSLMYETIRIVGQNRPKYVLWENVKNILSKKHKHNFDKYIETLETLGYNSYYQVLNAKDYGIPQNRERVYTISIRKDIDVDYKFPEKEELKLRLKDLLETEVEEKYYLKDYQIENIKKSTFMVNKRRIQEKDYCDTLCARDWKDPKCVQVGTLDIKGHDSIKRVYSQEGLSPTLTDMQGGNRQPKIIEEDIINPLKGISGKSWQFEQNVYANESKCLRSIKAGGGSGNIPKVIENPKIKNVGNIYGKGQNGNVYDTNGISPTISSGATNTKGNGGIGSNNAPKIIEDFYKSRAATEYKDVSPTLRSERIGLKIKDNYRIRKLTPKECWRLMGFSDEDFERAANIPTSNTQLYKQAGNSIVVDVLEKIFKNLFEV